MHRWYGKVAVVTGASSGIGLATAKALVQHGVIVVGLARRKELMEKSITSKEGSGSFYAKKCDIASEENVIDSFNWVKDNFGSMNMLINNAGVASASKLEDAPTSSIQNTVNVNFLGLSYCTKQAIKLMKENEGESHIVNLCSILGHSVLPAKRGYANVYSATKFAVKALSKTLRQELLQTKIRVSNISPGMTNAEIMEHQWQANPELRSWPLLQPEDVANCIVHALAVPLHVEITELTLRPRRT